MQVIQANNINEAYLVGMHLLSEQGDNRDSRNGPVLVHPGPVTTVYERPENRVLFSPSRDANPFFHFMEGLWMIAGRNDVDWISQFNSTIDQFSDDGVTFHGAYGHRWMNHFDDNSDGNSYALDQLDIVIERLKKDPTDRRCVVSMWDPVVDLGKDGKDFPCNTQIYFKITVLGALDMIVLNRSNDIIWGAYGANVVHMSMMMEYVASSIGVPLGIYRQMSNDFHAYKEIFESKKDVFDEEPRKYPGAFPMVNSPISTWDGELKMFIEEGPVMGFTDPFFRKVASPMFQAWKTWKDKQNPNRIDDAISCMESCVAEDWKIACIEWLERRRK